MQSKKYKKSHTKGMLEKKATRLAEGTTKVTDRGGERRFFVVVVVVCVWEGKLRVYVSD